MNYFDLILLVFKEYPFNFIVVVLCLILMIYFTIHFYKNEYEYPDALPFLIFLIAMDIGVILLIFQAAHVLYPEYCHFW